MDPLLYCAQWLDNARVGCGWRNFLILRQGRKLAWLLCTETADSIVIPLTALKDALRNARPLPLVPTRLARRLRALGKTHAKENSRALRYALSRLRTSRNTPAPKDPK